MLARSLGRRAHRHPDVDSKSTFVPRDDEQPLFGAAILGGLLVYDGLAQPIRCDDIVRIAHPLGVRLRWTTQYGKKQMRRLSCVAIGVAVPAEIDRLTRLHELTDLLQVVRAGLPNSDSNTFFDSTPGGNPQSSAFR